MTSFHWDEQSIEEQIRCQFGLDEYDSSGYNALQYICKNMPEADLVERIIKAGVNVDTPYNGGKQWTAMHFASNTENKQVIQVLLRYGAKIDPRDSVQYTPLMYAVRDGSPEHVNFLIEQAADVNVECRYGRTPLFLTVVSGSLQKVRSIISAGASINKKNKFGKSFIVLAFEYAWYDVIEYLMELNVDINPVLEDSCFEYYVEALPKIGQYIENKIHTLHEDNIKTWKSIRLKQLFKG